MKIFQVKNHKTKKAFTLLETMVALFVFSIAMVAVSGIFVSFVKTNTEVRKTQKNLEDAEQAINRLAKKIRTSSVIEMPPNDRSRIRLLEYSQLQNPMCYEYKFEDGYLQMATSNPTVDFFADIDQCRTFSMPATGFYHVIEPQVAGTFLIDPSGVSHIGKVTIILEFTQGTLKIPIQSTVSLRDYTEL